MQANYAVTATVDDANYEGSASGTLVINKATPAVDTWPTASDITYGDTLGDSDAELAEYRTVFREHSHLTAPGTCTWCRHS
jgi:hypothetical protein